MRRDCYCTRQLALSESDTRKLPARYGASEWDCVGEEMLEAGVVVRYTFDAWKSSVIKYVSPGAATATRFITRLLSMINSWPGCACNPSELTEIGSVCDTLISGILKGMSEILDGACPSAAGGP